MLDLINLEGGAYKSKELLHIVNDDCIKVMKHIPNKSISLILCDLPYG